MWDPNTYLDFADERGRPFHELLARIGAVNPRRVVDIGCGPGNLTETLRHRWPEAEITAFDSSPAMIEQARARGLNARVTDVRDWTPKPDDEVLISNAVLQWVPTWRAVLRGWLDAAGPGTWIALQVPGNLDAPSHQHIRELAAQPRWRGPLADVELRAANPTTPTELGELFLDAGWRPDVWESTYLQRLSGPDPVLAWISGTALRPIRQALSDADFERFRAELAPSLRAAYPRGTDGGTWFPFRRVFGVGRR